MKHVEAHHFLFTWNSKPKRISKKYERTGYNGKFQYEDRTDEMTPGEIAIRMSLLEALRAKFLESREALRLAEEANSVMSGNTVINNFPASYAVGSPAQPHAQVQGASLFGGILAADFQANRSNPERNRATGTGLNQSLSLSRRQLLQAATMRRSNGHSSSVGGNHSFLRGGRPFTGLELGRALSQPTAGPVDEGRMFSELLKLRNQQVIRDLALRRGQLLGSSPVRVADFAGLTEGGQDENKKRKISLDLGDVEEPLSKSARCA